ncbi:hypothetical protein [Paenibacillus woosongensis]|uniref:Uncharacterized protein n=1 Tax=Paenibacillus woosongensis TaxID=307580 RepID=A0ABQ4MYU3_9BACL|nr:hypothetical protein [Paenibacillus woosongensis]GIP61105.1 hypothetical protein J15TS10_49190 [Paenibacillus woosongensis]
MKYFEVLYANCFGVKKVTLVATPHDTPETRTLDFNFGWNGNEIIDYRETNQCSYASSTRRFYRED